MKNFPNKSQLLSNFSNCIDWEERYMYIIDLGKLLPEFPKNMRIKKFLISSCQSKTWIMLTIPTILAPSSLLIKDNNSNLLQSIVILYGDSDSSIVKGLITIIFIMYQGLTLREIIHYNIKPFLEEKLKLRKHLTASRSQGILAILDAIHTQAQKIKN